VDIRGLAHITGGGVIDNLPRVLPDGMGAALRRGTWPEPPIFGLIQQTGGISDEEMFHVFNMGLGMLVMVPPEQVASAQAVLGDDVFVVGEIVADKSGVEILGR
jgi:phosphoribosylformylglycinamidine cyclo-ligase